MSPRAAWDRLGDRLRGLSSRDRRALILGAVVLVPALAWILIVRPYFEVLDELQDRAATERQLLDRELEALREAPTFPDRIARTRRELARWEARFVRSPNLALAEAEVTSLLEEVALEARVLLEEVSAMASGAGTQVPEGLRPIRLSVRGESDFEGVLAFLHELEQNPMLLRIVGLSVQRAAGQGGGGGQGDGGSATQPGAMTFQLVVEAFAPEPSPAGAS